ncbi:hypothetical protein IE4803_PB00131 (plasmid) [Rhizobium etli bv. phaseoli str. IE4803]|nr:hypothetical protein IE4803_PB00131 [Rhizobium etli bv. phaseoli str. IE4803]
MAAGYQVGLVNQWMEGIGDPLLRTSETRHYEPGSDGGGRSWATIATLLQTAKMNSVDPRLAHANARAHRQWLAKQRNRRAHALELRPLNGLSLPLTYDEASN